MKDYIDDLKRRAEVSIAEAVKFDVELQKLIAKKCKLREDKIALKVCY